ncbi:MAG: pitrilysin family protein [Nitrospirota bacterium]
MFLKMFRKDILDNAIRVVSEVVPASHSVSIGVWVMAGSRDESYEKNGTSHFIEHMFFKGTERRTAKDIAIEVDSIGGELNAFTSREETTFYARSLDEHLPVALDLLSDIFLHSVFDPQEIEKEKRIILEEIKMVEDTPDDYIHDLYYKTAWEDNPLGQPVLGRREIIESLKRDDLIEYINGSYYPENIVISGTGNLNQDEFLRLLNKTFGKLNRGKGHSRNTRPRFIGKVSGKRKKLESVHLCLGVEGLKHTDEDRYGLLILNSILGSSVSSRLFQEIREKRGLAYSIYSYAISYRDTGMLTAYAATDRTKVNEVISLILSEFENLRGKVPGNGEITKAKEQIKGNFILSLESTINKMTLIARQEIYFNRNFTPEEIIHNIDSVTSDQVQRLAQNLFRKDIALTTLGPISLKGIPVPTNIC